MATKKKTTTKKAPAKAKGPDNNKRLAALEAQEAIRDYPRAFDAGRRAKRSSIPENQAPVMSDKERVAYLEGYKVG